MTSPQEDQRDFVYRHGTVFYLAGDWPSASEWIAVPDARDYTPEGTCPLCLNPDCWRDSVDVGVGTIYGPWGCPQCGWSEADEYDLSGDATGIADDGSFTDQYGVRYPAANPVARAARIAAGSSEPLGFHSDDPLYTQAGPKKST